MVGCSLYFVAMSISQTYGILYYVHSDASSWDCKIWTRDKTRDKSHKYTNMADLVCKISRGYYVTVSELRYFTTVLITWLTLTRYIKCYIKQKQISDQHIFLVIMSSVVKRRMVVCEKCQTPMRYDKLARHLEKCVGKGRFCPVCECMLMGKTPEQIRTHLVNCGRKWYVNSALSQNILHFSIGYTSFWKFDQFCL